MRIIVDAIEGYTASLFHFFNEHISDYPNPKLSKYSSFQSFVQFIMANEEDDYKKYILILNASYNIYMHINIWFNLNSVHIEKNTDLDENIKELLDDLNLKIANISKDNIYSFERRDKDVDSILDELQDQDLEDDISLYLDSENLWDVKNSVSLGVNEG